MPAAGAACMSSFRGSGMGRVTDGAAHTSVCGTAALRSPFGRKWPHGADCRAHIAHGRRMNCRQPVDKRAPISGRSYQGAWWRCRQHTAVSRSGAAVTSYTAAPPHSVKAFRSDDGKWLELGISFM